MVIYLKILYVVTIFHLAKHQANFARSCSLSSNVKALGCKSKIPLSTNRYFRICLSWIYFEFFGAFQSFSGHLTFIDFRRWVRFNSAICQIVCVHCGLVIYHVAAVVTAACSGLKYPWKYVKYIEPLEDIPADILLLQLINYRWPFYRWN